MNLVYSIILLLQGLLLIFFQQMVSFRQKKLFGVVGSIVVVVALCYLLGHVDF